MLCPTQALTELPGSRKTTLPECIARHELTGFLDIPWLEAGGKRAHATVTAEFVIFLIVNITGQSRHWSSNTSADDVL